MNRDAFRSKYVQLYIVLIQHLFLNRWKSILINKSCLFACARTGLIKILMASIKRYKIFIWEKNWMFFLTFRRGISLLLFALPIRINIVLPIKINMRSIKKLAMRLYFTVIVWTTKGYDDLTYWTIKYLIEYLNWTCFSQGTRKRQINRAYLLVKTKYVTKIPSLLLSLIYLQSFFNYRKKSPNTCCTVSSLS